MKRALISVSAIAALTTPAQAMEQVHTVSVSGTEYHVVELLHAKRERLPKWNALRFRRGDHYREYRLLDSSYTLKIYDAQYKRLKFALKDVPDNRAWDEKHPYYQPTISTVTTLLTIINSTK